MSSPEELPNSSLTLVNRVQDDIKISNGSIGSRSGDNLVDLDADQYEERFRVDRRKLEQMLHHGRYIHVYLCVKYSTYYCVQYIPVMIVMLVLYYPALVKVNHKHKMVNKPYAAYACCLLSYHIMLCYACSSIHSINVCHCHVCIYSFQCMLYFTY